MPPFIMLTRLNPDAVRSPRGLEQLERDAMKATSKSLILAVPDTISALEDWCRECSQAPAVELSDFPPLRILRHHAPVAVGLGQCGGRAHQLSILSGRCAL
jgi:hypothetical protein